MTDLKNTPNLGPANVKYLHGIGVYSLEELREMGSRRAWLNVRENVPGLHCNFLYAFEGAIRGICWFRLPPELKAELRAFYLDVRHMEE
ncbi:TfoX/Sxy family protein [Synergistaceae bacterium OttesenSCG-928-D05]|nr:TfoX/Sxy family protein [Synergistaceae bacterium OttesenSCG-928-D05]